MAEPISLLSAALTRLSQSPVEISSAANPRYRQLTELFESARARRRERLTVLEGWHLLESWLMSPQHLSRQQNLPAIQSLVLPQRTWRRLQADGQGHGAGHPGRPTAGQHERQSGLNDHQTGQYGHDAGPHHGAEQVPETGTSRAIQALHAARWLVLDDRLFDSLDVLPSPAPVLALVPTPQPELPARIDGQDAVILDRVQDPGNVGAIIRTAAAAGIRLLITTPGTAACWAPKVLRAGMGGHFVMTMLESVGIDDLVARLQVPLVGTVVQPGRTLSLYQADLRAPVAWVFGNEGEGIDERLQTHLAQGITIPQTAGVESLNVAAAAAVCLFEQRRQRLMAG